MMLLLTNIWYMSSNNYLCQEHTEQQYSVQLLCYEYVEGLGGVPQPLLLAPLTYCTLLYDIESMLCNLLIPACHVPLADNVPL